MMSRISIVILIYHGHKPIEGNAMFRGHTVNQRFSCPCLGTVHKGFTDCPHNLRTSHVVEKLSLNIQSISQLK
jgi:hypothetical protein